MNHDEDYEPLDFEDEPHRRRSHRGSTAYMPDKRFSTLIGWAWTALGAAAVTGVWVFSSNLYQLNQTVAKEAIYREWMAQQIADTKALDERQEDHFHAIDNEIATMKGTNLRGPPEARRVR